MEPNSTPPITSVLAVIVDYQSHDEAAALSLQLTTLSHSGFRVEVVHVDNCSPDPHLPAVEQKARGIRFLRLPANNGYAGGLNETITALDPEGKNYDAYWFLNADFRAEPDCLSELVRALNQNPRVAAAGPRIFKEDSTQVWGARGIVNPWLGVTSMKDWPQGGILPRWSYLPGCSILARAGPYHELQGLPARYRLYFEETEYCIQLQRRGYDLWVEPRAVAHHRVDSLRHGVPARHFAFYFVRNNLFFWKNCFGIPWFVQLPRTVFVVFKEVVLPLRRARSPSEAWDRLQYLWFGFVDGFEFLNSRFTRNELRLFFGKR